MRSSRPAPPPLAAGAAAAAAILVAATACVGGGCGVPVASATSLHVPVASATPLHEAIYPPNDEYDPHVFDPLSAFGAPHGGYARASRSRLASLPLRLVGGAAEFDLDGPSRRGGQLRPDGSDGGGGEEEEQQQQGRGGSGSGDADAASSSSASAPHFRMSDSDGRQFVCRVYDEEELEPHSVLGSMFDAPEVRPVPKPPVDGDDGGDDGEGGGDDDDEEEYEDYYDDEDDYYYDHGDGAANHERDGRRVLYADPEGQFALSGSAPDQHRSGQAAEEHHQQKQQHPHHHVTVHPTDIARQLAKLDGVCAQVHPGWWSYEWCHEGQVTQFHVAIVVSQQQEQGQEEEEAESGGGGSPKPTRKFEIQDVTNVGKFSRRVVRIDDGRGGKPGELPGAASDDGHPLLSGSVVVTDTFIDGDWCEEFGVHRTVDVEMRCCPGDVTGDPDLMRKVEDGTRPRAVLKTVKESRVDKCSYVAQVCTPLLCSEAFSGDGGVVGEANSDGDESPVKNKKKKKRKKKKKGESIRDILDRALGNHCLQRNAGWWTYELCHTRHAREFHGTNVLDAKTGISRQVVEEEHFLGLYDPDVHESFPDAEEVDHVVNATDATGAAPKGSGGGANKMMAVEAADGSIKVQVAGGAAPSEAGGNGAVFVQEYTHGLVCDHADVADSVIKGGNIVGGGIERSTTVRFSCGKSYELVKVNEDSTCHYIFDVTVPALCGHPLFKASVVKTQVVKCLPVDFAFD